jgi:nucleotide-binding universal stress UspA family protein
MRSTPFHGDRRRDLGTTAVTLQREPTKHRTIERIVVPVDESPESERAMPVAIRFAQRLQVQAELLAVANESTRAGLMRSRLARLAHEAGTPVNAIEVLEVVATDDIAPAIGRHVIIHHGSVLVMSGHGPTRTSGVLTDSLTAELLAEGLPVVVVGPRAFARPADLPIVACLDGSAESEQAIPVAAAWASALHVPLVLMVVELPPLDSVPQLFPVEAQQHFDADLLLQRAAAEITASWPELTVRLHVVRYPWTVPEALSIYLRRHPAQLFAVATHIRSGWARLVNPSTTARIVRHLAAPVLIVPIEPEHVETLPLKGSHEAPTVGPFREIIVPVDPHHLTASVGVLTAMNLAQAANASLRFVTCDPDASDTDDRASKRAGLTNAVRPLQSRWEVLESADVANAILHVASSTPDSIVCVSTHAPRQITDAFLSTTTGQLIRWSPRTVVLVGPHCVLPDAEYCEIAGFVDGSLISESVAELVGQWAQSLGLPAHIIEVVEPTTNVPGSTSVADHYVNRLAGRVSRQHGIPTMGQTIDNADVVSAIREWADIHPNALLVLASHGAGLSDHVLGGVVMDVARHVPNPVVVVPAHTV